MPQVPKAAMRAGIEAAALELFARHGFARTGVADVAALAGTATANVYRYHSSKRALFDAVVPATLLAEHDDLLDARIAALVTGTPTGPAAQALLDFWLDHRLAVVVLLDRAEGTPHERYPERLVQRWVDHAVAELDAPPTPDHLTLLRLVFDNTRRALARLLEIDADRARTAALIEGFWSYQVPGLAGLARWPGSGQTRAASTATP